jgi:DNA polymerase III delta subunit
LIPAEDAPERQNIRLLHGDDSFSMQREIRRQTRSLLNPADADMNSLRLEGKTASLEEIQTAVSTLSFFGSDRLVLLEGLPAKMEKARQEKFLKILDGMPESTTLLLVMEDHPRWRMVNGQWAQTWEILNDTHWLQRWAKGKPNVLIRPFALPQVREMDSWILKEAKEQGGTFSNEAAHELTQTIGNDTSIASQEIGKLLMYVNGSRPVSRADVILLVSEAGSSDVFSMLDAMCEGRTREAQLLLHRQLDDTPPEMILGAVVHRFRQLIQVREALDSGEDLRGLVAQRVIFAGRAADRAASQARRYSLADLSSIYRRLLDLDIQSKTSASDLETNLELLVVQVAGM